MGPRAARRETTWRGVTILVLVLAGVYAADAWGIRWLRAPWSYAALGPTLTGTWAAPVTARLGAEYRILLDLAYRQEERIRSGFWDHTLTGHAWICTSTGDVHEYALDGDANRSGDSIVVRLTYPDPSQSALDNRLEGGWHADTLTLRPLRNPFQPDGSFVLNRTVSTADPDDSFGTGQFRRSDRQSFMAACGRLSR